MLKLHLRKKKEEDSLDLWTKPYFRKWKELFELCSVETCLSGSPVSLWTVWILRMELDYISITDTLYELFLWNSLCSDNCWALGLGFFLQDWRCVALMKPVWDPKRLNAQAAVDLLTKFWIVWVYIGQSIYHK